MEWQGQVNRSTCRLCSESIDNDRPKVIDTPRVGGGVVGIGWVHVSCAQEAARRVQLTHRAVTPRAW
jgi:hypothetical protein